MQGYCLKYKNEPKKFLCTEKYLKNSSSLIPEGKYESIKCDSMEELINYALVMGEDIEIPEKYKITKIYNLLYVIGDFNPKDRNFSKVHSVVMNTSTNEESINKIFRRNIKNINKPLIVETDKMCCWQSEDYSYNQIVHAYCKEVSYLIEIKDCTQTILQEIDKEFEKLNYTRITCNEGWFYFNSELNKCILYNRDSCSISCYNYDDEEAMEMSSEELNIAIKLFALGGRDGDRN